jgi:hypothetical protein
VQRALVANLSVMIETLNLENQANKMQIQKMQTVDHADWNCGLQTQFCKLLSRLNV